jgi:hypothetical protein
MATRIDDSTAQTIVGATAVATAGGAITFALFPFLLPGVVLLAVLAIPLLPLLVLGAVGYAAFALIRGLARLARRSGVSGADRRTDPRSRTSAQRPRPSGSAGRPAGRPAG